MRSAFSTIILASFLLPIGGVAASDQMEREEFLGASELSSDDLGIIFGSDKIEVREIEILKHNQMKELRGGVVLVGYKLALTNLLRTSGIAGCSKSPACVRAIVAANSPRIATENSSELINRANVIQRGAEAREANFLGIRLFSASLFARALSALRTPESR